MAWAQLLYLPSCVVSCWPLLCVPPSQSWSGRWFGACLSRGCSPESMRALARSAHLTFGRRAVLSFEPEQLRGPPSTGHQTRQTTPASTSKAQAFCPSMSSISLPAFTHPSSSPCRLTGRPRNRAHERSISQGREDRQG
ncbi:hypothetical protein EV126DRAFT_403340 [Verticillium dahliae]|nr:hypothetical protein EV126DRAFT_403340 [Verticillium dahliae]